MSEEWCADATLDELYELAREARRRYIETRRELERRGEHPIETFPNNAMFGGITRFNVADSHGDTLCKMVVTAGRAGS